MAGGSDEWAVWLDRHKGFELKSKLLYRGQPVTLTVGHTKLQQAVAHPIRFRRWRLNLC